MNRAARLFKTVDDDEFRTQGEVRGAACLWML